MVVGARVVGGAVGAAVVGATVVGGAVVVLTVEAVVVVDSSGTWPTAAVVPATTRVADSADAEAARTKRCRSSIGPSSAHRGPRGVPRNG